MKVPMKRVLLWLFGLALLGAGCIVAVLVIGGHDVPPPDVSDLAMDRPAVAPAENAYTYFRAATNSFYWPTNRSLVRDYLEGKPCDEEAIQEVIARNKESMALIQQGLACKVCLTPGGTPRFDALLPYLPFWMNMGKALALRTKHSRLAGQYAEANDNCISLLGFGDILQSNPETIIHYLVSVAVLELGLTQAQDLALDKDTPPSELQRLATALAGLGPRSSGLIRALKGEYHFATNVLDQMQSGKLGLGELANLGGSEDTSPWWNGKRIPGYLFKPNQTRLLAANFNRNMITNAVLHYAAMKHYDAEAALGLKGSEVLLFAMPNAVGKILCGLTVPALAKALERKCRTECNIAGARLLLALAIYEKANGCLPETLDDLVPACIAAIPLDPYDGKPFRYVFSKGIVYSVGKDLKDDGGSSTLLPGYKPDALSRMRWNAKDAVFAVRNEAIP
jgi:hypothetical protein